jgi:inosose dehydratase
MIKIANAPCSWGALEFEMDGEILGYVQVLSEMKETGYQGTELGDWGFMPTDPAELKKTLQNFDLELLGAFLPVALSDSEKYQKGEEMVIKTAQLMYDAGFPDAFVILADDNCTVETRTINAGRVTPDIGLTDELWKSFSSRAERIARSVKEKFGMRMVFHHHCGGFVETPNEIETLLNLTDPDLLGLLLDTGHYAFGGGDPVHALETHIDRIWHVHFKDYEPEVGKQVAEKKLDYFKAVEQGVFCELGKGNVDFVSIVDKLNNNGYKGWIVVEQDVLPGMGSPKKCALNNREFIRGLGL